MRAPVAVEVASISGPNSKGEARRPPNRTVACSEVAVPRCPAGAARSTRTVSVTTAASALAPFGAAALAAPLGGYSPLFGALALISGLSVLVATDAKARRQPTTALPGADAHRNCTEPRAVGRGDLGEGFARVRLRHG